MVAHSATLEDVYDESNGSEDNSPTEGPKKKPAAQKKTSDVKKKGVAPKKSPKVIRRRLATAVEKLKEKLVAAEAELALLGTEGAET